MLTPIFIMLLVMLPILVPAIKRQLQKPEFTDMDMFKDFVSNDLFKNLDVAVPTKIPGTNFSEPDFRFLDPVNERQFFIKCFYCSDPKKTDFTWCDSQQFTNFKTLAEFPLFLIFGIGGPSHFPDKLYLVRFNQIESNKVQLSQLTKYEVIYNQRIDFSAY